MSGQGGHKDRIVSVLSKRVFGRDCYQREYKTPFLLPVQHYYVCIQLYVTGHHG